MLDRHICLGLGTFPRPFLYITEDFKFRGPDINMWNRNISSLLYRGVQSMYAYVCT